MHTISATDAKQNFSETLERAEREPVTIQRHGKTVAMMVPAGYASAELVERRLARAQQENIESARLIRHQRLAMRLLAATPAQARELVRAADRVVDRWERESLCSQHFIGRWRMLLALPPRDLAQQMCGDADGWGTALRQNSPWVGQ